LKNEKWLGSVARVSGRSYKQMRVMILEFLDTGVFHVSLENCVSFLDPLTDSWDIDLATFSMYRRTSRGSARSLRMLHLAAM
jgi:hypothetical protein